MFEYEHCGTCPNNTTCQFIVDTYGNSTQITADLEAKAVEEGRHSMNYAALIVRAWSNPLRSSYRLLDVIGMMERIGCSHEGTVIRGILEDAKVYYEENPPVQKYF